MPENHNNSLDPTFWSEVADLSGQQVQLCFQCQKCASGCTVLQDAKSDYMPDQVMRMVVLGMRDRVLRSRAIWLCSGCNTCTARCPNGIDIAAVMDALKELAVRHGVALPKESTKDFHSGYVKHIARRGRICEPLLVGMYEVKTGRILDDLMQGLTLMKKGKMPMQTMVTARVRDKQDVRRIFRHVEEHRGR